MVETAKDAWDAWWKGLSRWGKRGTVLFGALVGVGSILVGFARVYPIPYRVGSLETRVGSLETHQASQDSLLATLEWRQVRNEAKYQANMEYVACSFRVLQHLSREDCKQELVDKQLTGKIP